jgi:integrase
MVNAWRTGYIQRAGTNPVARQSAIRSANVYLRGVRALFSRKWLSRLQIRLPDPLPFADVKDVKLEKVPPTRDKSSINPAVLFADARKELAPTDAGAYLAFLLALGTGLRKSEIDGLEWKHINFTKGAITIEPTHYRDLKTEESATEVEIDAVFAEELRKFKPVGEPTFVINSNLRPRPGIDREYYRAEPVFQRLYTWLRAKGIKTRSPLHTLRKEFGSAVSSYYTENKRRIALPMADYLHGHPQALGKPSSKEKPAG